MYVCKVQQQGIPIWKEDISSLHPPALLEKCPRICMQGCSSFWHKCVYDKHWHNKILYSNQVFIQSQLDFSYLSCINHKPICLNVGPINNMLKATQLSKLFFNILCIRYNYFVVTNKYFVVLLYSFYSYKLVFCVHVIYVFSPMSLRGFSNSKIGSSIFCTFVNLVLNLLMVEHHTCNCQVRKLSSTDIALVCYRNPVIVCW